MCSPSCGVERGPHYHHSITACHIPLLFTSLSCICLLPGARQHQLSFSEVDLRSLSQGGEEGKGTTLTAQQQGAQGLKMCLYTLMKPSFDQSFTGTLVYLEKSLRFYYPNISVVLLLHIHTSAHTHTHSKVHYHTGLSVMDFLVLLQ